MTKTELLAWADRMRQNGGADRDVVHAECERSAENGDIRLDEVTTLYRHLMIHAGAVRPCTLDENRFRVCPICEATLLVTND